MNSNLIRSFILTTMIGIFAFRHQKSYKWKKDATARE